MKRILLVIGVLFTFQSFAAEPTNTFCSSGDLNMTGGNNCISTCSAISANSVKWLSKDSSGFCRGQSSLQKITLYKIALGRESSGSEPICTIWNGEYVVSTSAKEAGTSSNAGIIDLSSCPSGSYDVVHLTASRFQDYAGDTIFPDGSGDVVRTTSTFASDSADYTTVSDWLETSPSHSDDSKGYVTVTGYSNVFNKLSSAPSATNLTSSTNTTMRYDWLKAMKAGDSGERSGWLCDEESFCDRAVGSNKRESRIRDTETTIVEGLPLNIKNGDVTLSTLDIGYYSTSSASRSGTEELGMKVLWHNDGGTLKYLGAKPHDDGLYIKFGTLRSWD